MRLTLDLILEAPQSMTPTKDRMISIRGYKISAIENLGCTEDLFDCIDLSDNEIIKLTNIPPLKKLKSLYLANNRISRISEGVFDFVPNLTSLILTNNKIENLGELLTIFKAKNLVRLSILDNPVTTVDNYRKLVIGHMPNLRYLDFLRIRQNERNEANKFIKTEEAQKILRKAAKSTKKEEEEKEKENVSSKLQNTSELPTVEQIEKIKMAIAKASTIEEVTELENALKCGKFSRNEDQVMDEGLDEDDYDDNDATTNHNKKNK